MLPGERSSLAIVRRLAAEIMRQPARAREAAEEIVREVDGTLDLLSESHVEPISKSGRPKKYENCACACGRKIRAKGLCLRCYQLVRKGKEPVVCVSTNHAPNVRRTGGRPAKLHRCKWCRKLYSARKLRGHVAQCAKHRAA